MSFFVDEKYLELISGSLNRFEQKSAAVWNCRCPYCNDSKTNSRKARGYFFHGKKEQNVVFSCHNCGVTTSLENFIEDNFPQYTAQYKLDNLKKVKKLSFIDESKKTPPRKDYKKIFVKPSSVSLDTLPKTHVAVQYLLSRGITDLNLFQYTDDFNRYTAEQTNNSEEYDKIPKEPRIIIPIKSPTGDIWGFQGRSLNKKSTLRYITVKNSEQFHKIFGLDRYNKNKAGFIVEGPFDSLFLPNCLGMCGSNFDFTAVEDGYIIPENTITIFDNEPRNPQIVDKMMKMVNDGFRVYVPPKSVSTFDKDINEMVLSGWTRNELIQLFVGNSFSGAKAKVKINDWKKV